MITPAMQCPVDECPREFGSAAALNQHIAIDHTVDPRQ